MALISGREGSPVGNRAAWLVAGVFRFGGDRLAATRRGTHGSGGSRKDRFGPRRGQYLRPPAPQGRVALDLGDRLCQPCSFRRLPSPRRTEGSWRTRHRSFTMRELRCVRRAPASVLVAVDDAHLLDNLSATLIHLLAVAASARLILTARSGEPMPDAVTSLWKDSLIVRLNIEAIRSDSIDTAHRDGSRWAARDRQREPRLHDEPGAIPPVLYATPLVEGAVHAGCASGGRRRLAATWRNSADPTASPIFISRHLSSLSTPVPGCAGVSLDRRTAPRCPTCRRSPVATAVEEAEAGRAPCTVTQLVAHEA